MKNFRSTTGPFLERPYYSALDLVEAGLNDLLPPPGAAPKATLPMEWFGDEAEGGTRAADSDRAE